MSKLFVFCTICNIFLQCLTDQCNSNSSNLVSVVVLYRHGLRAPLKTYKNDPFNGTHWGAEYGHLNNIGKHQLYDLGKWLRMRYTNFLPIKYSHKDIKIVSSDTDRCLMSAAVNLAGLYPPEGEQIWNKDLLWQPIPIHTTPGNEDAILKQKKTCPKYDKLYEELLHSEYFKNVMNTNEKLFKYVSSNSGENITSLHEMKSFYGIIQVQNYFNVTLPEWINVIFPKKLEELALLSEQSATFTKELAKLKTGPLIDNIISHFENMLSVNGTPKFLMYSAHDSTLINMLNAMQVYNCVWPEFASTLIFELRRNCEKNYVNIFFKNGADIAKIALRECDFNCNFDTFKRILEPVRINLQQREHDCVCKNCILK